MSGRLTGSMERAFTPDRKTIRKVLRGEYSGYSRREAQPYPTLGPFLKTINSWLEADKTAPKNQRHTAARVFQRLIVEEGFKGSESTVRRYVRKAKPCRVLPSVAALTARSRSCWPEVSDGEGSATNRSGSESCY